MLSSQRAHKRWGFADFFDERRKSLFIKIAQLNPSDVFYDLGCGDASLLVYVARKCKLKRAVGFENMKSRARKANLSIKKAGLEGTVTIEDDMYDADLRQATVVFDMMPESMDDYRLLYSGKKMKKGTRLIKHDLPLIGFLPDKVELPFYMMRFPFRRASTREGWAESVMMSKKATAEDVWRELYYYSFEKTYAKNEIDNFKRMLRTRVSRHSVGTMCAR